MSTKVAMTRRNFLRTIAIGVASVTLAACGATPTPTPLPTATKAPAPAPTSAPAAASTAAPTKATVATTVPTAAAAPTTAPKAGAALIAKNIEGPEIITDTSKYPKTFKEAPQLADLVKAGKLPPADQRIGQDPLVLKPIKEIGKYGGTWRGAFTGPGDGYAGWRLAAGTDHLLYLNPTGDKVVPNIARDFKVSDDGKTTTLYLRKGMKWSDGQPFNADDLMFWYNDFYMNKELSPSGLAVLIIADQPVTMEKVDDYTVTYKAAGPYYYFPWNLATSTFGQAVGSASSGGGYMPAHYLKQFHPKYADKATLDKLVADAKYDNWTKLIKFKCNWQLNPELPVVSPWIVTSPNNTATWAFDRNPYSIWVDTDGNQLPYIDKIVLTLAESTDVLNLRTIAGEYDLQARNVDIRNLPLLLDNQEKGNYKVYLDTADFGTDAGIMFNLTYNADPEINKWINSLDFRHAFSMAIDRDQLNQTFWVGTGTPSSVAPADTNLYSPGPEYRKLWATLDVAKANSLLDGLGLTKKDADGMRQRLDGKGKLTIQVTTIGKQFMDFTAIMTMVKDQVKKIGIDLQITEMERSLAVTKGSNNEHQISLWSNDSGAHLFSGSGHIFPTGDTDPGQPGTLYAKWLQSGGKDPKGLEPPTWLKTIMDDWKKGVSVSDEERIKLGKKIWAACADAAFIVGTCGLSPASGGVRVVKNTMGNIPARQMILAGNYMQPAISRPQQFYFKS